MFSPVGRGHMTRAKSGNSGPRLIHPNARRPSCCRCRPRRPAGPSVRQLGRCAPSITARIVAVAVATSLSATSNTSSSWTCSSIRVSRSPAAARAAGMRTIARLMMSALVPWIGALIAARSANCRSLGVLGMDHRQVRLAPEQGLDIAGVLRMLDGFGHVGADAGEAREIQLDVARRLAAIDAEALRQPERGNAVDDRKVDRLGAGAGASRLSSPNTSCAVRAWTSPPDA